MPLFEVREDDLSSAPTLALLKLHLAGMHAASPAGAVFALDLSDLKRPEVTVWTAWRGDQAISIGAIRMLADGNAEVKSMRTHSDFARMGAGEAILDKIIATARARGAQRLSLETGSGTSFEPALNLYRKRGFVNGNAFASYTRSDFNQFLHLAL